MDARIAASAISVPSAASAGSRSPGPPAALAGLNAAKSL